MSTKHARGQKRTDPRDAYIQIGIDDETGAHHLYRTHDEQIMVVRDGQITYRYDLLEEGKHINDWVRYVSQKRGWRYRELYIDMADAVDSSLR